MKSKDEILKEHKSFRNQMIGVAILLLGVGYLSNISLLLGFGCAYALIAVWNIFSYRNNVADKKLIDEYYQNK